MAGASQIIRCSRTVRSAAGSLAPPSEPIFAKHAPEIFRHDLSVMPLNGKEPSVSGFNRWKAGPTEATVRQWAQRFADANIGIHALSSVLAILDGDDAETYSQIRECVPDTPLRTRTRRGRHSYYRLSRSLRPRDFRQIGINADLKGPAANDYVVAPPSAHPDELDFHYALDDGCDWAARYDLPSLTNADIDNLIEHIAGSHEQAERIRRELLGDHRRSRMSGPITEGERANTLNDRLCREVAHCDDFAALLDCAFTINGDCDAALGEKEVVRIAGRVWEDYQAGNLQQWRGRAGRAQTTLSEINELSVRGSSGAYGHMLLAVLKIYHMARVRRGELFAICAEAMAGAQVILGWNRDNYRTATRALIDAGAIRFVKKGKVMGMKRDGNLYTFGPLVMDPLCS